MNILSIQTHIWVSFVPLESGWYNLRSIPSFENYKDFDFWAFQRATLIIPPHLGAFGPPKEWKQSTICWTPSYTQQVP